jgi:hypothetical protein
MLQGKIQHAAPGLWGFDVDSALNAEQCVTLKESYDFCLRYFPRTPEANVGASNLTQAEGEIILNAGLSLMCVQHVSNDNWSPTSDLGAQYGAYGARYLQEVVGAPPGFCAFLDLEMVNPSSSSEDIIGYCKAWFSAISGAGYVASLYVGYQSGLTPQQLYDLPFLHYWSAYNNDTQVPNRGFQMLQKTQKAVAGLEIDPNLTQADYMGDGVIFLSPA